MKEKTDVSRRGHLARVTATAAVVAVATIGLAVGAPAATAATAQPGDTLPISLVGTSPNDMMAEARAQAAAFCGAGGFWFEKGLYWSWGHTSDGKWTLNDTAVCA